MMHPRECLTEIGTQSTFNEKEASNVINNKQNQTFQGLKLK